jgi:hypothetical protein
VVLVSIIEFLVAVRYEDEIGHKYIIILQEH